MVINVGLLSRAGANTGNARTFQDIDAEMREKDRLAKMQKMQEQMAQINLAKAQQDLNAPKLPFQGTGFDTQIANEAYKFNLSKGLSDAEARQKAIDMVLGTKTDYKPVTDPYSGQTTLQPTPRAAMFGGGQLQQAATQPPMPQPVSSAPMALGPDPFAGRGMPMVDDSLPIAPGIDPRAAMSPEVQMDLAKGEGQLDRDKDLIEFKANLNNDIARANKELEKGTGADKINKILDDLEVINEQLKIKEAIVNEDQSGLDRAYAVLSKAGMTGAYEQAFTSDIATLRQDYENARASLIPYYIAANDLPATVADTEEFAQRILQSFGDAQGSYEGNKSAIARQRGLFGQKKAPTTRITLEEFLAE